MLHLELLPYLLLFILPFFFLFKSCFTYATKCYKKQSSSPAIKPPRSYPLIGSALTISANKGRFHPWVTELLQNSETGTIILQRSLGHRELITTNPLNVQHILKSQFSLYPKGSFSQDSLSSFLGSGIFNIDGESWKFQRQISSHAFNTKSLRKFIGTVVEDELSDRLLPLFDATAAQKSTLDLQDILQRFAFDNICKIAFGFDPKYLSQSFPQPETEFAIAFEEATLLSSGRLGSIFTWVWKAKMALDIGSEKKLRIAASKVREFAASIVKEKKRELEEKSSIETEDLLSRILNSGHSDESFVTDMVISFILAGRDTTSAALTWFFWLVSMNPRVENEILKEILKEKTEGLDHFNEVKDMVYTHAALCETMRLYPPVPSDGKQAVSDDVLPDGSVVKKGMQVVYHPYAMGRMESLWGKDWGEFRPERWLEKEEVTGKWKFVGRDSYTYPVFQAGPRVCLGKEMAFLQMKRVVAGVMKQYRVMPAEDGFEAVYFAHLTTKMKGGFPVKIEERRQ